jgi:hypothetical protein
VAWGPIQHSRKLGSKESQGEACRDEGTDQESRYPQELGDPRIMNCVEDPEYHQVHLGRAEPGSEDMPGCLLPSSWRF